MPSTGTKQQIVSSSRSRSAMVEALRTHWPEYLMEAAGLGLFMISACLFTVLLEHPASPVHQAIESGTARRALIGLAMGATAIAIICSPWGQRSGAHLNPSVTLSFLMLGKVQAWDACFYVGAQFLGGMAGVAAAALVLGAALRHTAIHYAVTLPGPHGPWTAFWAESVISFVLFSMILLMSNSRRLARYTPFAAGAAIAAYITVEAPFSGMSMNPARTLGSAVFAREWSALWIYFSAPVLGMLLAAWLYANRIGIERVFCAKLHHHNNQPCIFRCGYHTLENPWD